MNSTFTANGETFLEFFPNFKMSLNHCLGPIYADFKCWVKSHNFLLPVWSCLWPHQQKSTQVVCQSLLLGEERDAVLWLCILVDCLWRGMEPTNHSGNPAMTHLNSAIGTTFSGDVLLCYRMSLPRTIALLTHHLITSHATNTWLDLLPQFFWVSTTDLIAGYLLNHLEWTTSDRDMKNGFLYQFFWKKSYI